MGTYGQRYGEEAHCLVTGASGYIGGRLVPELLTVGHRVRCLARSLGELRDHPWAGDAETVRGDVMDAASVAAALRDIDVAYYLVYALGSGPDFKETDRRAARLFAEQAHSAGVRRIVYLGGLTPYGVPERALSPHLRSRAEVGRVFLDAPVPTAVLRAAVVIGSGPASFEMLRHLTERLPVMVTLGWGRTRTQPIGVRDVLRYLVGAAAMPDDVDRAFDIGGPDVLTYAQMTHRYAALARPLTESLRHEVVCREHGIARYVPGPPGRPLPFDEALALALRRVREAQVVTRWSSAAASGAPSGPLPTDPDWAGGSLYEDERRRPVGASGRALWQVVEGVGGGDGWYSFPPAWAVRGRLDRFVGGAGLRRGRRDAERRRAGDSLDFWRVGGGDRARTAAAVAGGNAVAGTGVTGDVHEDGRRGAHPLPAARPVPPARAARPRLLVVRLPVPRRRLRRHGPRHHPGRRQEHAQNRTTAPPHQE